MYRPRDRSRTEEVNRLAEAGRVLARLRLSRHSSPQASEDGLSNAWDWGGMGEDFLGGFQSISYYDIVRESYWVATR